MSVIEGFSVEAGAEEVGAAVGVVAVEEDAVEAAEAAPDGSPLTPPPEPRPSRRLPTSPVRYNHQGLV